MKDPAAQSLGRRGGLKSTAAQQLARKRNILKALAKQHPRSVRIRQELARLNGDNLVLGYCDMPHEGIVSPDRTTLIQNAHPKSLQCKNWEAEA